MKNATVLFVCIALSASAAFSGEGDVRRNSRRIPGRYIVVLASDADTASVVNTVRNIKSARIRHTYERGFKGFSLEMADADAQALARDARVQFVEEDSTITAAATWALDRIDQRALPLNGTYVGGGETGAGVTIYVVDTGILASHDDFRGRVAAGFSAFADDQGTSDCNGHGTHVAGLVGGLTHGVAPAVSLVPVRVLDCNGAGSISTLLAGLEWVLSDYAQSPRPSVVNMSLGGSASSALDAAVGKLIVSGLTAVAAAGNNNQDACMTSPARVPAAITVGATNETDQRSEFSNYGPCVDLFAPGSNVLSSSYMSATATEVSSGTSAAAPLVAGVAALYLEKYPDAAPGAVSQTIVSQATAGALSAIGDGSPNLLLFSLLGSLQEPSQEDSQLLADPSFEYGDTFWTSDVCTVVNPAGCTGRDDQDTGEEYYYLTLPSRSGKNKAVIGGPAPSFNLVSETVIVPPSVGRAELSVYVWVITKDKKPVAKDVLSVDIRDDNGVLLETLGSFSNVDAGPTYGLHRFDMTRYRGKAIRISFTGVQNPGPPTWFLLDDVNLRIWR